MTCVTRCMLSKCISICAFSRCIFRFSDISQIDVESNGLGRYRRALQHRFRVGNCFRQVKTNQTMAKTSVNFVKSFENRIAKVPHQPISQLILRTSAYCLWRRAALRVARLAQAMVSSTRLLVTADGSQVQIRVGLNSGVDRGSHRELECHFPCLNVCLRF